MLVIGCALIVASSGAFDSVTADRGATVETTGDENALFVLDYPGGDRTLSLDSDTSDEDATCVIGLCVEYEYNAEELVSVTDNTPSDELTIDSVEFNSDDEVAELLSYDETSIQGDFTCPASGSLTGGSDQDETSTTVDIDIVASSGGVTVALERAVTVYCIPD